MNAYLMASLTGARRTLAARGDLTTQVGMMLLVVLALSSVWHAATGAHGGVIGGYTWHSLVWYITVAEACTVPVPARVIEEIGEEIGAGDVAVAMLRPISVVWLRIAIDGGAALARQAICLVAGGALAWFLAGPPPLPGFLLALPACVIAMGVSLCLQHALGGIAFWLNDARSTWFLFQKLVLIGGGVLIPLGLLPAPLADVCKALPFAAIAYIPGLLASGHGTVAAYLPGLAWLAVAAALASFVFARGVRRLEVVGG